MAKATVQTEQVRRYQVDLSSDEAQFIKWLLGTRVVGSGKWRKVSDGIWDAMHNAKIEHANVKVKRGANSAFNSGYVELDKDE